MALNKVEICGVNTARLPLLKNEEKEALFERIKEGDSEARELYIKGNLRLVLSVIRRFGSSSENADDLFQIGCIGLMKAIDNFDSTLNVKEGYVKKNLKEPTITEIAEEIGIPKEEIVYAMDAIQTPMSLYDPVYTEGGDTLYVMDQISDKKNREENWIEVLSLNEAVKKLTDRERHIIRLRFYEGKTQMEVARLIRISQAQVSRLEKSALKTLRNYLR